MMMMMPGSENLELQQGEIESLQCIYDEQQFKLTKTPIITRGEEYELDDAASSSSTTYEFEIILNASLFSDATIVDDDGDDDDNDILTMKYHLKQTGVKLNVKLNPSYPTQSPPEVTICGAGKTADSFQSDSIIHDQIARGVIHKDIGLIFMCKKAIYARECKEVEQVVHEEANVMLPDGLPMIFSLISRIQEHLTEQVINDEELDRAIDEHSRKQLDQEKGDSSDGKGRVVKMDIWGNATVISKEQSPQPPSPPPPPNMKSPSVDIDINSVDHEMIDFKNMYKYSFRDSNSKLLQITLAPYLVFDKFVPREIPEESSLERLFHYSSLTSHSHIPIVYGGLSKRGTRPSNELYAINRDGKAIRLSQSGKYPVPRIFGSFTPVTLSNCDGFILIGGISSDGVIVNDVYCVVFSSFISENNMHTTVASWDFLTTLPAMYGHTACTIPNGSKYYPPILSSVLVFGGYNGETYSNQLYEIFPGYKTKKIDPCGSRPPARAGHAMSNLINNCIFVCGGHNEKGILSDMYMLEMATKTWTLLVTMGPAPHLTHSSSQSLMSHSGDTLTLYGGYDGNAWSNVLHEYSIPERRWRVCCSNKSDHSSSKNKGLAFSSCEVIRQNIAVMGGTTQYPKFTFNNYKSVIQQFFGNSSVTLPNYNAMVMYEYQSFQDLKYHNSLTNALVTSYFKWFKAQDEEECDMILQFWDADEDQEQSTTHIKGHDDDAKVLADEDGFKYLYCHKLILSQSPKLARMIAKTELRKEYDESKYDIEQGKCVTVQMFKQVGYETFGFRLFYKICQFLYTGSLVVDKYLEDKQNLFQLYKLAKLLHLNLLVQMLLGQVTVDTLSTDNLFTNMLHLSSPMLEPQELSAQEYDQLMKQIELEGEDHPPLDHDDSSYSGYMEDLCGDEEDTMYFEHAQPDTEHYNIDDNHPQQESTSNNNRGIVKLIATIAQNGTQETNEEPRYMSIRVHKGVLTSRSQYFRSVFLANFAESTSNVVRIDQCNIEGVRSLCSYLYSGLLPPLNPSSVVEVYMATHQFLLEELQPWLRSMIREFIDVNIACAICEISETLNDAHMRTFCIHYIAKHLDEILGNNNTELASDGGSDSVGSGHESFNILSRTTQFEVLSLYNKQNKNKKKNVQRKLIRK